MIFSETTFQKQISLAALFVYLLHHEQERWLWSHRQTIPSNMLQPQTADYL